MDNGEVHVERLAFIATESAADQIRASTLIGGTCP